MMKIIKSILNLVMSQEVTTAEELKREDPKDAAEIIAKYEIKNKEEKSK